MVINYDSEYLRELYEQGRCNDRKHRYQPAVVRNYQKCVKILSTVRRIEDLFPFNGLRYETLTGDKKGLSSVRIDDKYRLEFTISHGEATDEPFVTICTLTDITNHYR
ncbi:hypothetical protein FACS1894159_07720 [Bacteroidia bacterium]|nr:hypothetical protein FACS1894159_07720 [Bacteroidia bacterium]